MISAVPMPLEKSVTDPAPTHHSEILLFQESHECDTTQASTQLRRIPAVDNLTCFEHAAEEEIDMVSIGTNAQCPLSEKNDIGVEPLLSLASPCQSAHQDESVSASGPRWFQKSPISRRAQPKMSSPSSRFAAPENGGGIPRMSIFSRLKLHSSEVTSSDASGNSLDYIVPEPKWAPSNPRFKKSRGPAQDGNEDERGQNQYQNDAIDGNSVVHGFSRMQGTSDRKCVEEDDDDKPKSLKKLSDLSRMIRRSNSIDKDRYVCNKLSWMGAPDEKLSCDANAEDDLEGCESPWGVSAGAHETPDLQTSGNHPWLDNFLSPQGKLNSRENSASQMHNLHDRSSSSLSLKFMFHSSNSDFGTAGRGFAAVGRDTCCDDDAGGDGEDDDISVVAQRKGISMAFDPFIEFQNRSKIRAQPAKKN
jgi:hypothetical protein